MAATEMESATATDIYISQSLIDIQAKVIIGKDFSRGRPKS
jgi:hypothetical protein